MQKIIISFLWLLFAGFSPLTAQSQVAQSQVAQSKVKQSKAVSQVAAVQEGWGKILSGKVSDAFGQPMPFVSVYLKSNPQVGGSTGPDGGYQLDLQGVKPVKNDVVVFSYIGYKTEERGVRELLEGGEGLVQMVEQPILLEGAAVSARVSKKQEKALKESFLKKFKAQLEKDFPNVDREYQVVSSGLVSKDGEGTLLSNEFKGIFQEFPGKGRGGKDSLRIKKESIWGYTHRELETGLKKMGEKWRTDSIAIAEKTTAVLTEAAARGKNLKKGAPAKQVKVQQMHNRHIGSSLANMRNSQHEIEQRSLELHSGLWLFNSNVRRMVKQMENDPKFWSIDYTDDYTVLTYRKKKGFMGIVRMEMQIHFILDSYTYSVEKIAESMQVEVNIPIGYKLDSEMLALLNMVNIGGEQIEKYRLRHINVDARRNVMYLNSERGKVPQEKNLDARFSLEDTKDRLLKYQAKAITRVTQYTTGIPHP